MMLSEILKNKELTVTVLRWSIVAICKHVAARIACINRIPHWFSIYNNISTNAEHIDRFLLSDYIKPKNSELGLNSSPNQIMFHGNQLHQRYCIVVNVMNQDMTSYN